MSPNFIFYLFVITRCFAQLPDESEESMIRQDLGLYRNLEEVLNIFRRDAGPVSDEVVKVYQTECIYTQEPDVLTEKRKPFIVVEGNHKRSKEGVAMKLANLLNGRYIVQVAPCLRRFTTVIRGGDPLRRPLQFLSLYATAFDARVQLALGRSVVVSSYWTEQLSFTVTRSYHAGALPPITANFFQFPEDLMPPDMIVFVDFAEDMYSTTPATHGFYQISNVRKTTNLKKRKMQVYKHMQARLPIMIHSLQRVSNRATATEILHLIHANLSSVRDFDLERDEDYSCQWGGEDYIVTAGPGETERLV